MGAVIDPFARCGDPLAGRDHCGMPDHRDEFAVAARLDPQNAETIFSIVVRNALDKARQHFLGRWVRLRFPADCHISCFAFAGVLVENSIRLACSRESGDVSFHESAMSGSAALSRSWILLLIARSAHSQHV